MWASSQSKGKRGLEEIPGEAETYQAGPVCQGKEFGFSSKCGRKAFGRF